MLRKKSNQDVTRVAIACADDEFRALLVAHLQKASAELAVHSDLSKIAAIAQQNDIVLIFADGLGASPLRPCLDALERLSSGPVLILITDADPPAWVPTLERERLAKVVTRARWTTSGLDLVRSCNPQVAAPPTEYSGPELPFTD